MADARIVDVTESPNPVPKNKIRIEGPAGDMATIPWTAGQTFQQALGSAIPLAIRQRTNAFNATIWFVFEVRED